MFLLSITLSPREPCYREREYNLNKHPICFSTVTLISFTHESIVAIPPHTSALMDAVHCGHKVTRVAGGQGRGPSWGELDVLHILQAAVEQRRLLLM